MRRSPELLDVELDDVDDAPPAPSRPLWWRPVVAGVPQRAWAAAAAVAVAAAGGIAVADHRQEAALDARLSDVPGLAVSLAEPLAEAWRAPATGVMATTDDVLVLWSARPEGGVVAVDPDDGRVRYAQAGGCQTASVAPGPVDDLLAFAGAVVARDGDSTLLVCAEGGGQPGGPDAAPASTTALRVVALATGRELRTVPLGETASWIVLGSDVVSTALDPDRHVTVTRWSLESGEQRWSYRSPEPRTGAAGVDAVWFSGLSDDVVTVESNGWSAALDAATGAVLDGYAPGQGAEGGDDGPDDTADDGSGWGPVDTAAGLTLSGRWFPDGSSETTVRGGGGPPFTVPGYVLPASVDDGTAPGLLLVMRPTGGVDDGSVLSGVDAATGSTRWETPTTIGQALVLSGHVVVHDAAGTTVLDARTGSTRWTRSSGEPATHGWDIVTDGRRLVTVEHEEAGDVLVARDLLTGSAEWSAPAPVPDGALVLLEDGTVLVTGEAEVVALRVGDGA